MAASSVSWEKDIIFSMSLPLAYPMVKAPVSDHVQYMCTTSNRDASWTNTGLILDAKIITTPLTDYAIGELGICAAKSLIATGIEGIHSLAKYLFPSFRISMEIHWLLVGPSLFLQVHCSLG